MRNTKKLKKIFACVLTMVLTAGLIQTFPASLMSAQASDGNNFKVWLDELATGGTVEPGAYPYGDAGTVTLVGNGTEKFTQSYSAAVGVVRDGETVNGYKAGSRHATANDIPSIPAAGDGCCVEFEAKLTGTFKIYFQSTSFVRVWKFDTATGERDATAPYVDSEVAAESFAFKAEAGKTYVMSTTGKTNNMAYIGYQFIEDVPVTAAVELENVNVDASVLTNLEVYLTDSDLGGEPAAVLRQGDTSAALAKGHSYTVSTNDGGVRALVGDKDTFVCTGDKVTISLYNIPDVQLTGTITGAEAGTVTELKFTNMINGAEYTATIEGTSYTCTMKPGEYNTSVVAANGGFTKDRVSVQEDGENVNEVWVEFPPSGGSVAYTPDEIVAQCTCSATVSSRGSDLTAKPGDTITVPISGAAVVTVKAYYAADFEINGTPYSVTSGSTSQIDEFKVNASGDLTITFTGSATSYLKEIEVAPVVEFKDTISVPGDYATMKEAVAAIKGMDNRPAGEAGRITINLTADIFEQVVMDAPYVTLNGNDHEIAWYYGVGTFYYSVDPATGLYNERLARDKYSYTEGNGSLWGGVFIVRGNNFIANNTTFRNTYNYELTEAELTDIHHTVSGMPARVEGTDVTAYASKERSNAFYIEADNIECYNCKILSSQDTLGRNGSANNNYHVYFKDCVIGGNTDYICGEFAAIFDNCELQWKTFANDTKNNAKVGYIVAPKTSPYVFRNCVVTTDGVGTGVQGYWGRTWGQNSNTSFINTETNGLILDAGWGQMSNGEGATAIFKEYNNTQFGEVMYSNGEYCASANQTLEAVKDYIDSDTVSAVDTVLKGWRPVSYAQTPIDYTKVGTQLGEVEALDASLYTAETYAKVTELVQSIEWPGAAQSYLDEMADKIAAAIAALEKVEVPGDDTPNPEVPGGDTPAGPETDDKNSVNTGDSVNIMLYVALMAAAVLGAVLAVFARKRKRA